MSHVFRAYESEDDYWRLRDFLREVFLLNKRLERSWHVARLDYTRWHVCPNCTGVPFGEVVFLWEAESRIIALLIADGGPGEAHLCVHPDFRTPDLEEEMIDVAESCLPCVDLDGSKRLEIWATNQDVMREDILGEKGYSRGNGFHQWRRQLQDDLPCIHLPEGYTIRSVGEGLELLERCYASGLGFHKGDIKVAVDNRDDPTWYRSIQTAPLYRRDLDLVAAAQDGSIAAFCTIWFDDVTRSGYVEPVATVPAHQKKGLGRAVMTEGLRRLRRMGATVASVHGGNSGANAFYESVMGPDYELYEAWTKDLSG